MEYQLSNDRISVVLSDAGGQVLSVKNSAGTEYMWQGDPAYWNGRSFHIFPYVGRLTDEMYLLDGAAYHMGIHGIVQAAEMKAVRAERDTVSLALLSDGKTRRSYPYEFEYYQHYYLRGNQLCITYEVINNDTRTMYFGIGAHPAFRVPLEEGLCFADYRLELAEAHNPVRIGMTDACFVNGEQSPYALEQGGVIRLRHSLFDHDAVILKNAGNQVTLRAEGNERGISLCADGLEYLMLWSAPGKNAPYLCIEPVSSLSARQGVVEDLSKQKDLLALPEKKRYRCMVGITFF